MNTLALGALLYSKTWERAGPAPKFAEKTPKLPGAVHRLHAVAN